MDNLEALNIVLDGIGVYPVTSYSSPHPDAVRAKTSLERYTRSLQTRGWWFNRECGFVLQPTVDDEIILPMDVLVVDSIQPRDKYTKRGNRMYDPVNHTYTITESITVDMILELPFDFIPESVQDYIAQSAALNVATNREGDQNKMAMLNNEYLRAKSGAFADEIRNSNFNVFNSSLPARMISAVRPAVRRI